MRWLNIVIAVYAAILICAGLQGYISKGSMVSLAAGGIAGALMLGTLALAQTNPRPARIAAAVITLLLLGNFGGRYMGDPARDAWPNLIMAFLSLVVFLCLAGGHVYAMMTKNKVGVDPQAGSVSKLDPVTGLRRSEPGESVPESQSPEPRG